METNHFVVCLAWLTSNGSLPAVAWRVRSRPSIQSVFSGSFTPFLHLLPSHFSFFLPLKGQNLTQNWGNISFWIKKRRKTCCVLRAVLRYNARGLTSHMRVLSTLLLPRQLTNPAGISIFWIGRFHTRPISQEEEASRSATRLYWWEIVGCFLLASAS